MGTNSGSTEKSWLKALSSEGKFRKLVEKLFSASAFEQFLPFSHILASFA